MAMACLPTVVVIPAVYLGASSLYKNLEIAVAIFVGFCVGAVSSFIAAATTVASDQKHRAELGAARNWEHGVADWITAFAVFGGANFLVLIVAMLVLAGLGR